MYSVSKSPCDQRVEELYVTLLSLYTLITRAQKEDESRQIAHGERKQVAVFNVDHVRNNRVVRYACSLVPSDVLFELEGVGRTNRTRRTPAISRSKAMAYFLTSATPAPPILFNFNHFNHKFKFIKSINLNNKKQHPPPLDLGVVLVSPSPPSIRRRSFLLLCSSSSLLSEMESNANEGVYPLHHTKTIHLVRHAQGIHNVAGEKDHSAYMSEELFDAHLTPLGWQQVDNLRKHVHASGLSRSIELVVVSPLLRTMQTAVGAFGGEGSAAGNDVPPLMAENIGNSNRPAISSLNCPPFIAVELCREHLGVHPCDRRRSITEYKPMFPAIDFSLIENDGDVLWTADTREKNEDVAARGVKFMKWLLTREEKEIAVVTHSGFLFHTLLAYGDDCHPTLKKEMSKHFNNCELRSMVIVDRSMIGSNPSKTDFPGKIPSGSDVPSDAV